ncbi:methylated-DNA--[protein]-cysteine S-methyltransferase [Psychromarinibacter sp. C21-152]|uniref:Methylated-DNA--[protein]-cysteine S-methyltransferase n=1 Tax=Psychromarinibacter sediminicola TaxID=3033385 RepID=A0AAE3NSU2_9RHOB|nr:methylated-DNA--[protein]-cysteine S-methyltransferase [Psychromarinibacter sediminicola]MDF0600300.1 methylated-DNA--[protein]-cysteine S-methyltransferase [Psychromarinibacter sediminicola]
MAPRGGDAGVGGLDTPVGPVRVAVADGAVTGVGWGEAAGQGSDPVLDLALAELRAYFDGTLTAFTVPLRPPVSGLTARVLAEMQAIPYGETRTYGDLARALDVPAQALGQACGANPIPILIPFHRVLGATGLGGYSGAGGIETKVALLRLEGAGGLLI